MEVGIVGLGKMGGNMALRLIRGGHQVLANDLDPEAKAHLEEQGGRTVSDLEDLVSALEKPRVAWLMLPAGKITESVVDEILPLLDPGDILVDGANSFWKDSRRRAAKAAELSVDYVDCGVSGGVWGLESGYNLMLGGSEEAIGELVPLLETLSPEGGYLRTGGSGSGHFVKMIHNGIEYGLMQAYGEGFEAMASYPHGEIDLPAVARLWMKGSVVRSWLLELGLLALEQDPRLEDIRGYVEDSGMGRWTVDFAVEHAVPMHAITSALYARFASRQPNGFAARMAAALRKEFGGHAIVAMDTPAEDMVSQDDPGDEAMDEVERSG
ncbi:MAG TPA: decarboxylating 6-phosphogluconate dehydrogenase [Trueperaceae bacterium]